MREEAELVLNASPPLTELSAGGAAGADQGRAPKGAEKEGGEGRAGPLVGFADFTPPRGVPEQREQGPEGRSALWDCGAALACSVSGCLLVCRAVLRVIPSRR